MPAMKKGTGFIPWLGYAVMRAAIFVLHCFPVNLNLVTARLVGRIWWMFDATHRERVREHVRLALAKELDEREIERISRRSMQHLVMLVIEMIFTPRLITDATWRRYVRIGDMRETLRVLLEGKGVILLTGHYGSWELTGHLLALFGFDVKAIMRPLDNVYINRYLVRTRKAAGLELIDKKGAMDSSEELLQNGSAIGFIADQDAGRKGVFVDFFGVAASTYKSIALLAMQSEVPIIVGYARRLGDRFEYELGVERIIHPAEWQAVDDPMRWITQEYTAALEASIRRDLTQYLWIHRRWKSRPKVRRRAKG